MEYYDWEKNKSKRAYIALKYWPKRIEDIDVEKESVENDQNGQAYKEAVSAIFNEGEYHFHKYFA